MSTSTAEAPSTLPAGPFRRFAALVYDLMLLVSVLFLGTVVLLPFSGGEAITPQDSGAWEYLYRSWIAVLALGFFGVSWTRRGQTLGMMSWKIRVQREDGSRLGWMDSLKRLGIGGAVVITAVTGLWLLRSQGAAWAWIAGCALLVPVVVNYAWMWRDAGRRTLQDRLSRCRVVRLHD
ncbi:MAG: RDD family protein [Steroidobacteraceae bacterium]|nr:RDD family protein [Steroidobacteraceae bacterium]MCC7198033.1 RDD family protein [Gammaproteobacteria bacterium]